MRSLSHNKTKPLFTMQNQSQLSKDQAPEEAGNSSSPKNLPEPKSLSEIRRFQSGYEAGQEGLPRDSYEGAKNRLWKLWTHGWMLGDAGKEFPPRLIQKRERLMEVKKEQEEAYAERQEQKEEMRQRYEKRKEMEETRTEMASIKVEERQQKEVELDQIDLGVRYREEYGETDSLAESIKNVGILQPLLLLDKEKVDDISELQGELDFDRRYLLLAGGRRTYAARQAGLEEVPAYVFESQMSDREMRIVELQENVHRKDLTPYESNKLVQDIHEMMISQHGEAMQGVKGGWGQEDTAELLNMSRSSVTKKLETAEGMEKYPEAREADTDKKARKVIKQKEREKENREYRRKHEERMKKETPSEVDRQKKMLCERFVVGDFFEEVQRIEDESVNLVEMDPPYGIDFDEIIDGTFDRESVNRYEDINPDSYLKFMERALNECSRVMRDHSWLIVWYSEKEWYCDTAKLIESYDEFTLRRIPAYWHKDQGRTRVPKYHLATDTDSFFYVRKGKPPIIKQGRSNVFEYPITQNTGHRHPNAAPVEFYEDLLETFARPGSTVLVPFAGSGSSILAAHNLEMDAIGFDTEEKYKDAFDRKVWEGHPREYKSYGQ